MIAAEGRRVRFDKRERIYIYIHTYIHSVCALRFCGVRSEARPEVRSSAEHGVQQVILTDTDTIWLRDPRPYLARHPSADVFTTTDCNSHVAETYFLPGYRRCAPRSIHQPHLPIGTCTAECSCVLWRARQSWTLVRVVTCSTGACAGARRLAKTLFLFVAELLPLCASPPAILSSTRAAHTHARVRAASVPLVLPSALLRHRRARTPGRRPLGLGHQHGRDRVSQPARDRAVPARVAGGDGGPRVARATV